MAGDRREGDLAATARPAHGAQARSAAAGKPLFRADEARVPIVEEQVEIGKREVETGRVRVHTVVDEEKLNLTELLERDVVEIERVPVGREVDQAPLPFEDGDVLVIPVIEERLVVEKKLVVVEEVRIRRRQESAPANIPVTRRVMHAEIERSASRAAQPGPAPSAVDPRRAMPTPEAAPLHRPAPAVSAEPFERAGGTGARTSPMPGNARGRAEPNWAIIAIVIAVTILLLLAVAGRS